MVSLGHSLLWLYLQCGRCHVLISQFLHMPAMHLNKHVGSLMAILQPHKLKVTLLLLDIPLLPIHSLMHILHLAIQDDLVELVLQ
ncbi:hypothetical protein POPTR_002G161801v4 [Populus trichocarpa]|jgi:hypothetical protein|uniref:Uncharacterized protein n=1 Tax=Populus trichocarpa TaxID=3694 RepID=A0ACC0TES5_POPTR|nr:hypothetical protein BDE02_02G149900 [Populus trichocarpa]KAI9399900.1 hypothetical protein POPTR_002G161801v4 [Populus trichocarpa]